MKTTFSFLLLGLCCLVSTETASQTIYQTKAYTNMIRSLQVKVANQQISEPFIELNGNNQIEVNFDAMTHELRRYAYKIIHCNADWTPSTLSEIEYMNGFQGLLIEDYANSMATTTHYTNFRLFLPNQDIQLKVSGNYAVQVYNEDNPDEIVLTACFSVVESLVALEADITGNTDIDFNQGHQQLSFMINTKNFPISYPQSDLKIVVIQNGRKDNAVTQLKPTTISGNKIVYEHNRYLIFDAGNEFRRIEFLTNRYNGMNIDRITYHNPYYHVDVKIDPVLSGKTYHYDQDQNGRFFINCSGCNDPDSEADYFIVHFNLESGKAPNGEVYIGGELFNNRLDESSRMEYNPESGFYEKAVLLKGGNYNYQYLYLPNGEKKAQTAPFEGNYYQAENEYVIAIYYSPMGARYDRLIGKGKVQNAVPFVR